MVISGSHVKLYQNLICTNTNRLKVNPLSGVLDLLVSLSAIKPDSSIKFYLNTSLIVLQIFTLLYQISHCATEYKQLAASSDGDVDRALKFIATHYQNHITVDDICSEVCLSKYCFCKIFKQHTGTTLHQYLIGYRIQKSKELLAYSKIPINSVSAASGFNNLLTFYRSFKENAGMTPGNYRRNFDVPRLTPPHDN